MASPQEPWQGGDTRAEAQAAGAVVPGSPRPCQRTRTQKELASGKHGAMYARAEKDAREAQNRLERGLPATRLSTAAAQILEPMQLSPAKKKGGDAEPGGCAELGDQTGGGDGGRELGGLGVDEQRDGPPDGSSGRSRATAGLAVTFDALVPHLLAAIRPAETMVVQQSPKRKRRRTGEGEAGKAAPVGPRN